MRGKLGDMEGVETVVGICYERRIYFKLQRKKEEKNENGVQI